MLVWSYSNSFHGSNYAYIFYNYIFMPIFSTDRLDFLVTDVFLKEGIIHVPGNLSTGTDIAINVQQKTNKATQTIKER